MAETDLTYFLASRAASTKPVVSAYMRLFRVASAAKYGFWAVFTALNELSIDCWKVCNCATCNSVSLGVYVGSALTIPISSVK